MDQLSPALASFCKLTWEYVSQHKLSMVALTLGAGAAWYCYRPRNMPPGPWGYPFVGSQYSTLSLSPATEIKALKEMQKKYGDVFTLWLGGNKYHVIVNTYDAMIQLLTKQGNLFSHRNSADISLFTGMQDDIFAAEDTPAHRRVRKLVLSAFRTTGLNDGRWNQTMGVEFDEMADRLIKEERCPVNIFRLFNVAAANHFCVLVLGKKRLLGPSDTDNRKLVDIGNKLVTVAVEAFPKLRLPYPFRYYFEYQLKKEQRACLEPYFAAITESIHEHIESYDPSRIRDVCDAFIKTGEIEKLGIEQVMLNLAVLGPDSLVTLSTVFTWVMVFLVKFPDYQDQIYSEIEEFCQTSREPHVPLKSKAELPLTKAFIEEVLRYAPVFLLTFGQISHQDVQFRGFTIPKRTTVFFNTFAINRDPSRFEDPDKFWPERFMEVKGSETGNKKAPACPHLAFSTGPRSCVGELLAKNTLFFFMANLVHKFRFELPPGCPLPNADLMEDNQKFKVLAKRRK